MTLFEDRRRAGIELSKNLKDEIEIDTVVVPFPEALEVGLEVARNQGANLDLRLSEFITSPDAPYADIGAIADDNTLWIEDGLRNELGVSSSYIENKARIKSNAMKEQSKKLNREEALLKGKNAVIVSDGLSSGFREAAIAGSVMKKGAEKIYVATPVKSENMMADIDSVVDQFLYVHEVPFLSSPDACYEKNRREANINYRKHLTA
jgi:predicted phosphoribosyltransferase